MIIFKKRDENIYLITNYKVMFTTLKSQSNLIIVSSNKRLYLDSILSWFRPKSNFYLVVRDPFKRIESFYKNKFLRAEKVRIWLIKNKSKKEWETSTEFFFPYLSIDNDADPTKISKILSSTKFKKFISILPKIFDKDPHMRPQHYSQKILLKKFTNRLFIPIRFHKIFKIENQEDLSKLEYIFKINLTTKRNPSNKKNLIIWDNDSIKTVKNIYQKDFINFNYNQIPFNSDNENR